MWDILVVLESAEGGEENALFRFRFGAIMNPPEGAILLSL